MTHERYSTENPFGIIPHPDIFYPSSTHQSVLDELLQGIHAGDPMTVLVGAAGSGKTLLLLKIVDSLQPDRTTVFVPFSDLSFSQLIAYVDAKAPFCDGFEPQKRQPTPEDCLLRWTNTDLQLVLVIDDADRLPEATLKALSQFVRDAAHGVQCVLATTQDLGDKLVESSNALPVHRLYLTTLHHDEIAPYLEYRIATRCDAIYPRFDDRAIAYIQRLSKGVPARVHRICDYALHRAKLDNRSTITPELLAELMPEDQSEQGRFLGAGVPWLARAVEKLKTQPCAAGSDAQKDATTTEVVSPQSTADSARTPLPKLVGGLTSVYSRFVFDTRRLAGRLARCTLAGCLAKTNTNHRLVIAVVLAVCTLGWTWFEFGATAQSPVIELSNIPLPGGGHPSSVSVRVDTTMPLHTSEDNDPPQPQTPIASLDVETPVAPPLDSHAIVEPVQIDNARTIDALLLQARRQSAAHRLTRPAGDNALESYRLVLGVDPANPVAQHGLLLLRDRFVQQANDASLRGDYPAARVYYEKALLVDPDYGRARIELVRLPDREPTPTRSSQQAQAAQTPLSDHGASNSNMQTLFESAKVRLQNLLHNVKYEGVGSSDVERPDK